MNHRRPQKPPAPRRRNLAMWSPLLLTLVIAGFAIATPRDFSVSRLLPAAPALAASMWSVGGTAALGTVTLCLEIGIQLAYDEKATAFTAAALAAVTAAAAYAAHVRIQRERTLSQVRSVADAAQAVVLRPVPDRFGDVGIATLYLAAAEEARIGGDFFEAVETRYGVRVLIGDVRGKGLSAVGVASAVTNCFREAAHDEADLARLARRLDRSMVRYNRTLTSPDASERFATAVLAQIRTGSDVVELLNCGHPPPLLLHRGGARSLVPAEPSPPLNMASLIGGDYLVETVRVEPGDRLLLYTDGVSETRDRSGAFFRVGDWAAGKEGVSNPRLLAMLHEELLTFSHGALDDDIAALLLSRGREPAPTDGPAGATEA